MASAGASVVMVAFFLCVSDVPLRDGRPDVRVSFDALGFASPSDINLCIVMTKEAADHHGLNI